MLIRQMQLGKQGITENFINGLKTQFKNSQVMKISVLKSATRDREEIVKIKDELLEKLGKNFRSSQAAEKFHGNFTGRIIGFTIILRKWRKARS
ncbi:YhbY family RNA-binding protein [Candidatus Pacearchaeota archaeon]|nr:YhbY family RNA-binding protein [Candidatus Pacearchaeota archaeon]MBI2057282.1 YhbY family RNA-binding protein [Candidatus Pacearchaeota archaeon]